MLCIATAALSDWPLDHIRDVDTDDETIRGLLRSQFIVPAQRVHQERAAEPAPEDEAPKRKRST